MTVSSSGRYIGDPHDTDCIRLFTEGKLPLQNLCDSCTLVFMAALNASIRDLVWADFWRERVVGPVIRADPGA